MRVQVADNTSAARQSGEIRFRVKNDPGQHVRGTLRTGAWRKKPSMAGKFASLTIANSQRNDKSAKG